MAKDGRYYKRFNFKAVPMEEYEVRLLLNRKFSTEVRIADLILKSGSSNSIKDSSTHKKMFQHLNYEIIFQVANIGIAIEDDYKLELYIPSQLISASLNLNVHLLKYSIREEEEVHVYSVKANGILRVPPQLDVTICDFKISYSFEVNWNINSSGNLSIFLLTAWFRTLVLTSYSSAKSLSSIIFILRTI